MSANGSVESVHPPVWNATFYISGSAPITITGAGSNVPEVPSFAAPECTLSYESPDQLRGGYQYKGQIGPDRINLYLENGSGAMALVGSLNAPLKSATNVEGECYINNPEASQR